VPAVRMHTEALARRGETRRWMSAAGVASGDRVLAGNNNNQDDMYVACVVRALACDSTLSKLFTHVCLYQKAV